MEEGKEALFHWPSSWKWHHKNNNNDHGSSNLQNPRSEITRNTNCSNTSQSANNVSQGLGLRLRIKIKGPSPKPEPNNNNLQQPFLCHVYNRGFTSAKSLCGHMRIHSLSKKHDHKVRNRRVSSFIENPTCGLCGKTLSSDKSLFGHMRVHPESVRKGIETPTSFDSSESLSGRSATGKRSSKKDKGLEQQGFEVDLQMQEAAYTLMLMSKGNPGGEVKKLASDHFPLTKKPRIKDKDKSLGMVGSEKGSFQSIFGDSDGRSNQIMDQFGSNLSTPEQMQYHANNNTTMQVGGIKATAEEDIKIIRHDQGQICNKTSSTAQANRAETHSAKAMEKVQNCFQSL